MRWESFLLVSIGAASRWAETAPMRILLRDFYDRYGLSTRQRRKGPWRECRFYGRLTVTILAIGQAGAAGRPTAAG